MTQDWSKATSTLSIAATPRGVLLLRNSKVTATREFDNGYSSIAHSKKCTDIRTQLDS